MNLSDPDVLAQVLEACLLAAGRPLSLAKLGELFDDAERPDSTRLRQALERLRSTCHERSFELVEVASGYRLQVRQAFAPWVGRLWDERPQRYSRALLETLALIAYRQPITRGEVEEVRGVAVSSQIIRTLVDRDWVRVVGYREVPGRPALYATTRAFLDHFNLKSLTELPALGPLLEPASQATAADDLPDGLPSEQGTGMLEAVPLAGDENGFRKLLAELDRMEQGVRTDFDDWAGSDSSSGDSQIP